MLPDHLKRKRLEREAAGLVRQRRIAETPCAPRQRLSSPDASARELLTFCSNDYLGLAAHPALAAALAEGARRWGTGSGASHLINGHSRAHAALEARLAALYRPHIPGAQALLFCSGFAANLALLTTLGERSAHLFADKLNHASLIDGGRLAPATMQRYPHARLDRLDALLRACPGPLKLVASDTVFSMDGDLAALPELLALAEQHDAWLILDDAHGFGVLGENGLGALEHFGLSSERFIYMGTLGKAAGVGGAFVAAHPAIIDALIQGGRSYVYTTAMPPPQAHALQTSLALLVGEEGRTRRARLNAHIAHLRRQLGGWLADTPQDGWRLAPSPTAIQPLIVGDNRRALALSAALEAAGVLVPAIRPPTVAPGSARLRIALSAAHQPADIDRLCRTLAACVHAPDTPEPAPLVLPAAPVTRPGPPAAQPVPLRGVFVTGTDTEVGKTRVSAALLHGWGRLGLVTAGLKPVAAGLTGHGGQQVNEDVQALQAAATLKASDAEVGPCQLTAACAPHIAAALEGRRIEPAVLLAAAQALARRADWLVVEGVGGFRVPLATGYDSADLACALGLPVVLVVGLRLGCLNHALLSAEAIRARGLVLAGWVANTLDPALPHRAANLAALREALAPAPCLGELPWLAEPSPAALAAHFDAAALRRLATPVSGCPPFLPAPKTVMTSTLASVSPEALRATAHRPAPRPAPSAWQVAEVEALFALPFMDLVHRAQSVHREHFDANALQLSTLLSIKTGGCAEDCGYCAQSAHFDTDVQAGKLIALDEVLAAAQAAQASGASRFCMGAAWRSPKARDMGALTEMVREVKALGLETCMTLGMLSPDQAGALKEAGLDYYNHNLDTAPDYYGEVISTRQYQERLDTLGHVRRAGLHVCSGGIVGMGESRRQRAALIAELANLDPAPESVPINHLVPVRGTPLADTPPLDPFEFVRTIAVARITMPRSRVRLSAGRETMDDALQALCILAGANAIFYGDHLLTTPNPATGRDRRLLERLDLRIEGAPEP